MIKVNCYRCNKELNELGAILFSPPNTGFIGSYGKVDKFHLCKSCYLLVLDVIE
jgi:hypothetical protein